MGDAAQLRADLATITKLHGNLPDMLTSRSGGGPNHGSRKVFARSAPPVNLTALDMLDGRQKLGGDDAEGMHQLDRMAGARRMGVLPDLWMWARMIEAEMIDAGAALPAELPESPTVATICRWLSQVTEWAVGAPWWPEYVHDIHETAQRIAATVGEPAGAEPTRHGGEDGCGMIVSQLGPERFVCSGCGKSWTLEAVTLPDAAQRLGISLRTLQSWAARSLLVELPGQSERRRMYDFEGIRRIVAEKRSRNARV